MSRSYEESCKLLDQIVGRCVRDPQFSALVMADPSAALREFDLTEDELEDFLILKDAHLTEATQVWTAIRAKLETSRDKDV
jgi:hypothetical protein